jgi:hypothetical protein
MQVVLVSMLFLLLCLKKKESGLVCFGYEQKAACVLV